MSELDQTLRSRLHTLARAEPCELDEPARTRIRAHVRAELGTRRAPLGWWLVAACAALAVLGLSSKTWRSSERGATVTPSSATRRATPARTAVTAQTSSLCAADESATFVHTKQGDTLDLTRALVVANAGATRVLELSSCSLQLELARGSVAIHARKLAGGRLGVHTSLGDVQVRGTIFAVESDTRRGLLLVSVAEGKVAIERKGHESVFVAVNERVQVSPDGGISRAPLSTTARARLLHTLGLPARHLREPVGAAKTEAISPHSEVEAARIFYTGSELSPPGPEPGSPQQADGRPMLKPHPKLQGVTP